MIDCLPLASKLESLKKDIMLQFVKCTKDDVTLNNFIARSRCLGYSIVHAQDNFISC